MAVQTRTADLVKEFEGHPAYARYRAWQRAEAHARTSRLQLSEVRVKHAELVERASRLDARAIGLDVQTLKDGAALADAEAAHREARDVAGEAKAAAARVEALEPTAADAEREAAAPRAHAEDLRQQLGQLGRELHQRTVQRIAKALRELATANAEEKAIAEAMVAVLDRPGAFIRRMPFQPENIGQEDSGNSGISLWFKEACEYGGYAV